MLQIKRKFLKLLSLLNATSGIGTIRTVFRNESCLFDSVAYYRNSCSEYNIRIYIHVCTAKIVYDYIKKI